MAEHRLFLLDGMALIYRAHFALIANPIYTSGGVNASALLGFTNTLVELLNNQNPTHIAVAFDTAAPTPRHEIFPAYKGQRDEMPEDLSAAIPHVKRLVRAFRMPVLELDGWEADDIIGTLAARAERELDGCLTFMVTPDKDFGQLVTEKSLIYRPGYRGSQAEIWDVAKVCEKWGISSPKQLIDILGLMGDASDNIPGVPGVGEKTAVKLVSQFGSVENLIASVDQLKGKLRERIAEHAEQARLSRHLAEIRTDAPIQVTFEEIKLEPMDEDAVKSIFVEFEFNALGRRLFGDDFKAGRGFALRAEGENSSPAAAKHGEHSGSSPGGGESAVQGALFPELKTLQDIEHDYKLIGDAKEAAQLAAELAGSDSFCFDVETSSLDARTCDIIGIAFSREARHGWYVDCRAPGMLDALRPALESDGAEKIGHNIKFDLGCLIANDLNPAGPFFDTMLVHSLVEPDQKHGMDFLSEAYLGYTPVPIEKLIGERKSPSGQLSMAELADGRLDEIVEYAAEDADVTWQLAQILRPMLAEKNQERVYRDIEAPLLPVLARMEHAGVKLDAGALVEIRADLEGQIASLTERICQAAGTTFNLNSPKQLGQILFDVLKLADKPRKTRTGQYRTDEQALAALSHHPVVQDILAYREASKLKNTYVDTLPAAVNARSGRIHTTFHQLLTATGRLASNNPNLQNIPIRTEQGREIRRAFVAGEPGWMILSADYSQIELRIMASISGDEAMIEAFNSGMDIHSATAARVFRVKPEDVAEDMRRTAKMVNFGIIYGISAFGLSQRLGIPRREAAEIIEAYLKEYSGVRQFMDSIIEEARRNGFVETLTGRRRYLRDINSSNNNIRSAAERTAINTPIQGTAADMIKIAMAKVDSVLRDGGFQSRMLLQVHDELVFEIPPDEADAVTAAVVAEMTNALPLKVPVVVEAGAGANWLEAH